MKQRLGELETQFFAYIQMRRMRAVRLGDLTGSPLGISADQARKLLSRLARGCMIARVQKGPLPRPATLAARWKVEPGHEALLLLKFVSSQLVKLRIGMRIAALIFKRYLPMFPSDLAGVSK
jgi:hypothetical protein